MKRTLYLGNTEDGAVFVWIELSTKDAADRPYDTTSLSVGAVEGPDTAGNARGGLGRPNVELSGRMTKLAPGWTVEMIDELAEVTERWHLNTLRAGSPAQRDYMRLYSQQFDVTYPTSHYDNACERLASAGLNPDRAMDPPYAYGSAWLSEELPAEVVGFLTGLPNGGGRRPPGEWDR